MTQIADLPHFIITTIITALFFVLFGLMLYQTLRKNRKAYVLTISIFVGGLGGILGMLQDLLAGASRYLLFYSLIVWSICYFLIYLFFEELDTSKPNRLRLVVASILFMASILFNQLFLFIPGVSGSIIESLTNPTLISFFEDFSIFKRTLELMWDGAYDGLGVFIFVFGAYVHFKSYKTNRELIPLFQAIALIFIGIGFISGFTGDVVRGVDFDFGLVGDALKIVGMLVFSLIYIIRVDFIYRLPVDVFFIMVFTKTGLNVHISRVRNPRRKEWETITDRKTNENLLSALISAVSGLMKESLGSEKPLETIVAKDRTFVLDSGDLATCAVLCERPTFFLERSIKILRKSVENQFHDSLKKSAINKADFDEVEQLIREVFPFLVIEQEIKL
ncbi:hypothetical protein EU523_01520 [Candidatus Heimdallarchaeota archaeon]|nr:MAG: hypothetical protein EU523_01520 [Candidatus Heimdallarchaeota archaeon]